MNKSQDSHESKYQIFDDMDDPPTLNTESMQSQGGVYWPGLFLFLIGDMLYDVNTSLPEYPPAPLRAEGVVERA